MLLVKIRTEKCFEPFDFLLLLRFSWFLVVAALLTSCGTNDEGSIGVLEIQYSLAREYTGIEFNTLTITTVGDIQDDFLFSISNTTATVGVEMGVYLPLKSQEINFNYADEGVYAADFKVQKSNGQPILFEVLNWEFSEEIPDVPIISFANTATNSLVNTILLSDSRADNISSLWLGNHLKTTGKPEVDVDGYWSDVDRSTSGVSIELEAGDGIKTVDGRFRNIFGNQSSKGIPADIILKQTPPSNCAVIPLSTTIKDNKLSLLIQGTDPYQLYYSVFGSVKQVIDKKKVSNNEVVYIYTDPTPGLKSFRINIEDIAGNFCPEAELDVTLDPDFVPEVITVSGASYWTESSSVIVDVVFQYFSTQGPIQVKISGDVSGPKTGIWLDDYSNVSLDLNPTTSESHTILAQYRDANGDESYLISKTIFLKPTISVTTLGDGSREVVVSQIVGLESLTIAGCVESYLDSAFAASYPCTPNAASATVIYSFPGGESLTKTVPF